MDKESINEVLSILQENYEASKNMVEEDRQRSSWEMVMETYEDLIAIFNNKRNHLDDKNNFILLKQEELEHQLSLLKDVQQAREMKYIRHVQKTENLLHALKQIAQDPYPEDVFLPITSQQWAEIHHTLKEKFHMPLDRLSGAYGRLFRKPMADIASEALNKYNEPD